MTAAIICQLALWIWFLGCTVTYRIGKHLLVEGMGVKSAEFAVLCLYSLGIAAFHCFQPAGNGSCPEYCSSGSSFSLCATGTIRSSEQASES